MTNNECEEEPQGHTPSDFVNFHGVPREVSDVEPEVIECLIPSEPDTCRGQRNHDAVHNHRSANDIKWIHQKRSPIYDQWTFSFGG